MIALAESLSSFEIESVDDLLGELDSLLYENEAEEDGRITLYLSGNRLPETGPITSVIERLRHTDPSAASKMLGFLEEQVPQKPEETLAVFADSTGARALRLAHPFPEFGCISPRWHLGPLLSLACNVDCYWVLEINPDSCRLFRGSRLGIRQESMPHTSSTLNSVAAPGRRFAQLDKESLFVNDALVGVRRAMKRSDAPLLVIASGEYAELIEDSDSIIENMLVERRAESLLTAEVHRLANQLLSEEFVKSRQRQMEKVCSIAFHEDTPKELRNILGHARDGEVESIILPSDKIAWGRYDSDEKKIEFLDRKNASGYDLFQWSAEAALDGGGELFYAPSSELPEGVEVCAKLKGEATESLSMESSCAEVCDE